MAKTLEQLTADRNKAYQAMDELRKKLPESGTWTDGADEKAWDSANADYDAATRSIDDLKKSADVRKRMDELDEQRKREERERGGDRRDPNDSRDGDKPGETAIELFSAWARSQYDANLTSRQRDLCQRHNFNPAQKQLRLSLGDTVYGRAVQRQRGNVHPSLRGEIEPRAMTVSATSGGEMISASIMPMFEAAMLDYSGILQTAEVIRTNNGEPFDWPTANDTGNAGAMLAINTAAASSGGDVVTAEMSLAAYKGTSKIVLVPTELIEDDSAGFVAAMPALLGERIGRLIEAQGTTGTGSSAPNGLVTAAAAGNVAASTTAITADEVIALEHTVDPSYRNDRSGFMCHDSIVKALRLLKDGESRYLWSSGLRDGRPDSLFGRRLVTNQNMTGTMAANAKVLLFGDLSKFKVRIVRDIRFYRLVERYRDADQDGFVAFVRFDTDLLNAGTNPVKYLAMAAA